VNYYEHHIGDYAQATAHLTFVEDAAYGRMLRKYYAEERPLPSEVSSVQRLVGARSREEKSAVQSVLGEFFFLNEDGWHNKRADAEIGHYREKSSKAAASARVRWDKQPQKDDANAMRTHSEGNATAHNGRNAHQTPDTRHQTPVTSNQTPEIKKNPKPLREDARVDDGFETFWKLYPKKTGKGAAMKAWSVAKPDVDVVLSALSWQSSSTAWTKDSGQFVPNPATYINQARWDDEPQTVRFGGMTEHGRQAALAAEEWLKSEGAI